MTLMNTLRAWKKSADLKVNSSSRIMTEVIYHTRPTQSISGNYRKEPSGDVVPLTYSDTRIVHFWLRLEWVSMRYRQGSVMPTQRLRKRFTCTRRLKWKKERINSSKRFTWSAENRMNTEKYGICLSGSITNLCKCRIFVSFQCRRRTLSMVFSSPCMSSNVHKIRLSKIAYHG